MVLRHTEFNKNKNLCFCTICAFGRPSCCGSLKKIDTLSTFQNTDKTGTFWHAKFIVKTYCFVIVTRRIIDIAVKTDGWCIWASPLRSGMQHLVPKVKKTLCFWGSLSWNINFCTEMRACAQARQKSYYLKSALAEQARNSITKPRHFEPVYCKAKVLWSSLPEVILPKISFGRTGTQFYYKAKILWAFLLQNQGTLTPLGHLWTNLGAIRNTWDAYFQPCWVDSVQHCWNAGPFCYETNALWALWVTFGPTWAQFGAPWILIFNHVESTPSNMVEMWALPLRNQCTLSSLGHLWINLGAIRSTLDADFQPCWVDSVHHGWNVGPFFSTFV